VKILFLTHRLPYAPNRGDRIRAFHLIRYLTGCAEVSVFSLVHDSDEAAHADDLKAFTHDVRIARVPRLLNMMRGAVRLPTHRPLTLELLYAPTIHAQLRAMVSERPPDLVFAYCSGMARYAMEAPLNRFPFVLDMVDVDSEKWKSLSRTARWPMRLIYRRESACLARFETTAVRSARVTLAVNQNEADAVRRLAADARVEVVQNGIDLETFAPREPPSDDPTAVFCGILNYGPNEEAALRLTQGIWPLVKKQRTDARLILAGAYPTAALHDAVRNDPTITLTGEVQDIRPYLWRSALAVVPLRTARGTQNKVLEALAAGLPTVVSPIVASGLPNAVQAGCAVAETDEEFAAIVVAWLARTPAERRELAIQARLQTLTWPEQLRSLCDMVRDAASPRV
jgi:sugar transferase (PEP-CTERM/EpsH1 system associated)